MKISKDAQAIVYRKNQDVIKFLLLKRYDKDKDEIHYRLIKGGVRPDEKNEEAALRETQEEAGLTQLKIVAKLGGYTYNAGDVQHEVEVFLIENTLEEEINPDSNEEGGFVIEAIEWLSAQIAIEKLNFEHEKSNLRKALNLL